MSIMIKFEVAMEVVLAMATSLYKKHGEFCSPATCPEDVEEALKTVEDFIVNQCEEEI